MIKAKYCTKLKFTLLCVSLLFFIGCNSEITELQLHLMSRPTYSPDGERILFSAYWGENDNKRNIFMLNLKDKNITRITQGKNDVEPVFSHDGRDIAYISFYNLEWGTKLIKLNLEDSNKTTINNEKKRIYRPSFSFNDENIIYSKSLRFGISSTGGKRWTNDDIYSYSFTEKKEKKLTNGNYYRAINPYFLEDEYIFIYRAYDGEDKLIIKNLKRNSDIKYISIENYTYLVWKDHIILVDKMNIIFMNKITFVEERIIDTTKYPKSISLSNDGDKLLFLSDIEPGWRNEDMRLFEMDLQSEEIKEINLNDYLIEQ